MNGFRYQAKKRNEKQQVRHMIINERIYERNFYLFEFGFIFLAIPLLILSLVSAPFCYYYIIVQEFHIWPIVIVVVITAFVQILAIQYYIKKFYLEPHQMTLGEYIRYLYDRRFEKIKAKAENQMREKTWYNDLENFIIKIKAEMKEQSDLIYQSMYENYEPEFEFDIK